MKCTSIKESGRTTNRATFPRILNPNIVYKVISISCKSSSLLVVQDLRNYSESEEWGKINITEVKLQIMTPAEVIKCQASDYSIENI